MKVDFLKVSLGIFSILLDAEAIWDDGKSFSDNLVLDFLFLKLLGCMIVFVGTGVLGW